MTLTKIASTGVEDSLRWVLGANGTSDYTFTGPGLTGTVNDPTIYLTRGHTYIFQNNSGGHPFYIKTSIANGGTNDAYNTGVTNNGGGNGTEIVFTVPHDSPDILYYQCSSHASMAGQFNIAGSVADGSISTAKIADDAVTDAKLANSINAAIAANTAKTSNATHTGEVTGSTALTIADDAVTQAKIAAGAIGNTELANGAVSTAKLGSNAVTSAKMADNSIGSAQLVSNAVTTAKITDANVTTAKIADDAVTAAKISDGTIQQFNLASNAVTTAKINANAVTTAKIADGSISTAKIGDNAVTHAKYQDIPTSRLLGRTSSGTGNPETLDASTVRSFLNVENGATASTGTTINNNADNRVITGSGTANTLNGESTITYDNPTLTISTSTAAYGSISLQGTSGGYIDFKNTGGRLWEIYTNSSEFDLYDRQNLRYHSKFKAGGNLELENGNLKFNTAGKGIDFSVNSNTGGSTSELLDDYEEGSFTIIAGSGSSVTFNSSNNRGSYVKIGRQVTIAGQTRINSGSGNVRISLPFGAASSTEDEDMNFCCAVIGYDYNAQNGSDCDGLFLLVDHGASYARFMEHRDNNPWTSLDGDPGAYLRFTLTYFTS